MAAAVGIGRFVYTPILPLMVEDLGMSKGAAGLLASVNFAGYLVGALIAAMPSLPGSRRRWLLVALAVSALTTGAMACTSSSAVFLGLRSIGGVASAFALVFSSALVLMTAAFGLGQIVAPTFAGMVYDATGTFLLPSLAAAAALLVAATLALLQPAPPSR